MGFDDPSDQEILRRIISKGIIEADLRIASDGQEALDYLNREGAYSSTNDAPKPDLVLLDLNMPRMNGFETLEEFRKIPNTKTMPVVVLTTSDSESDIIRSYGLGANSYITKPVAFEDFIHVIRELSEYWFDLVVLPPSN